VNITREGNRVRLEIDQLEALDLIAKLADVARKAQQYNLEQIGTTHTIFTEDGKNYPAVLVISVSKE
jgi:hypothetical protein